MRVASVVVCGWFLMGFSALAETPPAILDVGKLPTASAAARASYRDQFLVANLPRVYRELETAGLGLPGARRIGDAAAMIYQGRIIWSGPAADLMDSGVPEVDQFTHGRREGPIQMELRR